MSALQEILIGLGACEEARAWAGDRDPRTAWAECERGDCAELAWPHVQDTDALMACMLAVHVTREWCYGRADLDDVRAAAYAAYTAAYAAYAAAWDASRVAVLRKAADLVRARISVELIEAAIAAHRSAA